MKFGSRTFLLALIGAISAVLAFLISAPYTNTLGHPGLSPSDPRFNFTLGTRWSVVNHWAAGALLCFGFALVLSGGRKGLKFGLLSALIAAPLGGVLGALADSASDRIGIAIYERFGTLPFASAAVWSLLVPAAYATTVTICTGITGERLKRAAYAIVVAWIASFATTAIVSIAMAGLIQSGFLHMDLPTDTQDGGLALMKASIPIWEATAVAVGFVLGVVFSRAESLVRAASVMLVVGRNEGKEWNLDYVVNRIGTAEGVEIPIRGFSGVAPVHAQIVRHPQGFFLEDLSGGFLQLNGYPVQKAWLNANDMIGLGQIVLIFSSKRNARISGPQPMPGTVVAQMPLAQPVQASVPSAPQPFSPPSQAVLHPRLVDAFGNVYPLQTGSTLIGRDLTNPIGLHWDNSVSRRHAQVVMKGKLAEIRDLGSSNGTRVNGNLVKTAVPLSPGDAIQIGNVMLQYLV